MTGPEEGSSSKAPAPASGMIEEPVSPATILTFWKQIPEEYRMNVKGTPKDSVDFMQYLTQVGCAHPEQAALALGDSTRQQPWETSIEQMEQLSQHTCPAVNVTIPAQAATTFTPVQQMFKADDVPKYSDIKEYEAYRTNLLNFFGSIDSPPPQHFGMALRRILSRFTDPHAASAAEGWDVSNTIRATWDETKNEFISALDDKFESPTAAQDALLAWKKVYPKTDETPAQFFLRFEGSLAKLRSLQRRRGLPEVSEDAAKERLLSILPRDLVSSARDQLASIPNAIPLELQTAKDLRKLFTQKWNYMPKPAKTQHSTTKDFRTGNTRAVPATTNEVRTMGCGMVVSYDTDPPVPQAARGSIFPDPRNPANNAANARRRQYCIDHGLCKNCRRPQSAHSTVSAHFNPVENNARIRHTPAQPTPLPESRQIEAPPAPTVD
jgi:hypothetical protein